MSLPLDRDTHLQRTLDVIKAYSLTPVRIRAGQKAPTSDWDPRRVTVSEKVLANLGDDNLAVHMFGRIVDVDVDTFDPLITEALDLCLPVSTLVWGRASKPRSHRLYVLDQDFNRDEYAALLRAIKALKVENTSLSVEIRGGSKSAAFVSVLPGSIHPDGELYAWDTMDTSVSPTNVRASELVDAVRMAAVAAMISNYWVKGVRNDMSLALGGALWRMYSVVLSASEISGAEAPKSSEALERAERLMRTITTLADDDPADVKTRLMNLRNTWRKLDRDPSSKAVGATRLAELIGESGPQVVRNLYVLMADDAGALEFEELAERFRIWYGQGVLIDLDMVERGMSQFWMTREQAKNSMGGRTLTLGGKKIPVSSILFSSLAVGRVFGVTFDPSSTDTVIEQDDCAYVNQWRGFKVKPSDGVDESEIRPFLDYVFEIVANGDEKAYEWVLDWCADILQDPAKKPGTSLVLVGMPGAGKTFLGECILGAIIGPTHYGQTNSISSLTERFNQLVDNKLLLQCDEALHSYQRDTAARLKALVTDQTMRIEPKFVNPYVKPNHMRFVFTSNEETAALFIDATPAERRFTVLHVSGSRSSDGTYWQGLREWTTENLSKVAGYLVSRKYEKSTVRRPYMTEAKRVLQGVGVPLEVSWLNERLQNGFPLSSDVHQHWWQSFQMDKENEYATSNTLIADRWPDTIHLPALEEDFRRYVRERGKPLHTGNVWLTIRGAFPEASIESMGQRSVSVTDSYTNITQRRRVRLYTFPSMERILEHLEKKYGKVFGGLGDTLNTSVPNIEKAEY